MVFDLGVVAAYRLVLPSASTLLSVDTILVLSYVCGLGFGVFLWLCLDNL